MVNYLPSPPCDEEKWRYRNPNKMLLYVPGFFSATLLIGGMCLFMFAHPTLIVFAVIIALNSLYLIVSYVIGFLGNEFNFNSHEIRQRYYYMRGSFPRMDVYLPCCGESLNVLENTYKHVRALKWPEGSLHVYVLDDSKRHSVNLLADKYEFNYIARPNSGEMKKAGNLRYAFTRTDGEFFVVFDADFCPRPDFLNCLMPYMARDVAIVQSPQFFSLHEEQSWIEKGAGYIQEFFYRLVQVSRNTWFASICVGSNAIYRREALEPFGGTYPIEYSEDVHTGFMVTNAGWKVYYVPLCLAKGTCPDNVKSFFLQQYRWATGSLSLMVNKDFWTSKLTVMQKMCYLSGQLYYLSTGVSVLFTATPSLIMVWFYPDLVFWYNAAFSVPSFLFSFLVIPMWTKHPFGWYAPRCRVIASHAHLFAIIDKMRGTLVPWQASGNVGHVQRFFHLRHLLFWWTSITAALIFLGAGVQIDKIWHLIPTLFFTSFNAWLSLSVLRDQ